MMKRVLAALVVALVVLVAVGIYEWGFSGKPTDFSFSRITEGMTLERVEAILGPGEEISRERVPEWGQKSKHADGSVSNKVVEGDRFFMWDNGEGIGYGYYISFRDNKVVEKYDSFALFFRLSLSSLRPLDCRLGCGRSQYPI